MSDPYNPYANILRSLKFCDINFNFKKSLILRLLSARAFIFFLGIHENLPIISSFRLYQEFSYLFEFQNFLSHFVIRTVPISRSVFFPPGCVFIEGHRLSYSYNLVAARFGPFAPPLKQLRLKIFSV